MKLLKKLLLYFLIVLAAIQVPFIYRRYQTGKRAEKIAELQSNRTRPTDPIFREYRGVIHAHTSLGGHSTGSFDELIEAANEDNLDFVLMTEHWSDNYDTSALTLNGVYGRSLFIGGNEVDTADGDRFLMLPGSVDAAGFRKGKTVDFVRQIHAEKRVAMITYPETFKTWDSDFDGIEVLSLKTAGKQMNLFVALFDLIWTAPSYPGLMFAQQIRRPTENIKQFDEVTRGRRIGLFFGSDGHSNLGVHILGDDTGHKFLNIKLDPYRTVFDIVQLHILLNRNTPLTRESAIDALAAGHYYANLNVLGDSDGFRFEALDVGDPKQMGDELPYSEKLMMRVSMPVPAHCVVYKNGERFTEQSDAANYTFRPDGPGVYRVEVYLDQLGLEDDRMPWIMSNPIYVR